jgi:NADPH2:quinone reductase
MKAIRIERIGGPEVMQLQEIATPVPLEGEVLIQVAAAGVNYADLMQREDAYAVKTVLPTTLGGEIAGTIVALGPGVSHLSVGTRVTAMARGGYAEYAVAQSSAVIPIPERLDFPVLRLSFSRA